MCTATLRLPLDSVAHSSTPSRMFILVPQKQTLPHFDPSCVAAAVKTTAVKASPRPSPKPSPAPAVKRSTQDQVLCAAGSYMATWGKLTLCRLCPPGTFMEKASREGKCTPCPLGLISLPGARKCTKLGDIKIFDNSLAPLTLGR